MKRICIYCSMVALAILTFRCATDEVSEDIAGSDSHPLDSELSEFLSCQGFDLTDAKLYDEHIVLEHDIVIRLDEIKRMMNERTPGNGKTEQFVTNIGSIVTFNNVLDITFFIDNSVGPIDGDWEAAIRTATQNWEDLTYSRIGFTEVFTAGQADLVFYADTHTSLPTCARNLSSGTYAMAEFPGGGQPGRWISINDNDLSATQANRETVIRHELGHALGFRHDNPINGNGEQTNYTGSSACGNDVLGANLLVGTPTSDGASIMVPSIGTSTSINLSTNDAKSATFLYPAGYSAPQISTITQYYKSPTTKDININMVNPTVRMYRFRVERLPPWSSTPVQTTEYTTTSNSFWLLNVPHGTWNFRITSLNYARDASMPGITKMFTVQ